MIKYFFYLCCFVLIKHNAHSVAVQKEISQHPPVVAQSILNRAERLTQEKHERDTRKNKADAYLKKKYPCHRDGLCGYMSEIKYVKKIMNTFSRQSSGCWFGYHRHHQDIMTFKSMVTSQEHRQHTFYTLSFDPHLSQETVKSLQKYHQIRYNSSLFTVDVMSRHKDLTKALKKASWDNIDFNRYQRLDKIMKRTPYDLELSWEILCDLDDNGRFTISDNDLKVFQAVFRALYPDHTMIPQEILKIREAQKDLIDTVKQDFRYIYDITDKITQKIITMQTKEVAHITEDTADLWRWWDLGSYSALFQCDQKMLQALQRYAGRLTDRQLVSDDVMRRLIQRSVFNAGLASIRGTKNDDNVAMSIYDAYFWPEIKRYYAVNFLFENSDNPQETLSEFLRRMIFKHYTTSGSIYHVLSRATYDYVEAHLKENQHLNAEHTLLSSVDEHHYFSLASLMTYAGMINKKLYRENVVPVLKKMKTGKYQILPHKRSWMERFVETFPNKELQEALFNYALFVNPTVYNRLTENSSNTQGFISA